MGYGFAGSISPRAAKKLNGKLAVLKKTVGSVSKGGGIGKRESHVPSNNIDTAENEKVWPKGGGVSASNPKTGNTRMKGPIARSGGPYGGGGRDTQ